MGSLAKSLSLSLSLSYHPNKYTHKNVIGVTAVEGCGTYQLAKRMDSVIAI